MNRNAVSLRDDRHAGAPAETPNLLPGIHKHLSDSMRVALMTNPAAMVGCPGFTPPYQPAADLVYDDFAGKDGDASLHALLLIVGFAARGADVQLQASAWIAAFAKRHADYHAADMAQLVAEAA